MECNNKPRLFFPGIVILIFISWTTLLFIIPCSGSGSSSTTNPSNSNPLSLKDRILNSSSDFPSSYQYIIVSGLPYERGFSYGSQTKDKISKMISFYKHSKSMPSWADCDQFVESHYIPGLKSFYPRGLEEMKGIAAGAGVPLNDIVILNARYDLSRWKRSESIKANKKKVPLSFPDQQTSECLANSSLSYSSSLLEEAECTGAVVLSSASGKSGNVLLGQNWDTNEFILNNDTAVLLEVYPHSCENISPFIVLTEAGQLIRSGMNADGLGIVAMSLYSSDEVFERDEQKYPNGWVPATLLRRMFLEAPTFSMGLKAILSPPRHVPMNVIIATAEDEALNIELSAGQYFISNVPLDKEFLVHSNHFKSESFQAKDSVKEGSRGSSSLFRDRRVAIHLHKNWPNISETVLQEAFKDHVGFPNSVCAHSVPSDLSRTSSHPSETTVASIIFNLSKRSLLISKGPPCKGNYKLFKPF